MQEELAKERTSSMAALKETEAKVDRLNRQLDEASRSSSTSPTPSTAMITAPDSSSTSRIAQLTSALVHKQEALEAATAEKNSLLIRIENLEVSE